MEPRVLTALAVFILLIAASGCTNKPSGQGNETTEYEYYNASHEPSNVSGNSSAGNQTIDLPSGDFTFKIYGVDEFWMKANDTKRFDVVFKNTDEDGESHMFVARVFPSAANFSVMAAFQCLDFVTCDALLSRMRLMMDQPENSTLVTYGHVNLYSIGIRIPEDTPEGTYVFNMVACKDVAFADCTETSTNFGPNVPVTVHVL